MEQIKDKLPEALLTLTSGAKNSIQLNRPCPEWLPVEVTEQYNKTDLTYDFCIKLFFQLEAAKREKFPMETARQWFIEFIRRGWTKAILQKRYNALISTKIYGIEKLDFADWVNAVQVYGEDEINIMLRQRIESKILRGNFLKDKKVELTEEDKQNIDLAVAQEIEFQKKNEKLIMIDDYRQERRKLFSSKYDEGNPDATKQ